MREELDVNEVARIVLSTAPELVQGAASAAKPKRSRAR
jgi:hypothetical protein